MLRAQRFFSRPLRLRRARGERQGLADAAAVYAFAESYVPGGCHQLVDEIVPFLERVRDVGPRRICEIGCANGGTTLALSQSSASVELAVGVDLFVKNRAILHTLRPTAQRLACIDGPSLSPRVIARVLKVLDGEKLDVLLIDGDHSYEGALGDFNAYREMVRDGGLIAFHDIVPDAYPPEDSSTGARVTMPPRRGVAWAGGVPRLWSALSGSFDHQTYIADPGQHGFGIGVLEYRRDRVDDALREAHAASPS